MFPLWEVFRDVLDESTATDEFVLLHVAVAVDVPPPPTGQLVVRWRASRIVSAPSAPREPPRGSAARHHPRQPRRTIRRGPPRRRHGENPVERRAADWALRVMNAEFVGARQVKEVRARPRPLLPHPAPVLLGQHGRALRTQRVEAHRALAVRLGDVRVHADLGVDAPNPSFGRSDADSGAGREGGDERGGIRASHHRRHGPGVGRRPEPDVETETHPLRLLLRPRLGVCSPWRPRLEPSPRHRAVKCAVFGALARPITRATRKHLRAASCCCDEKHRHVSPRLCCRNRVIHCEKSDAALPTRAEFRVNLATRCP